MAARERIGVVERIAVRAASAAARTLESERQALSRECRTWLWLGSGALLVASMLAMVSAFYAVVTSRKEVERNQIAADPLRAYDQADVTLCGHRLCANVDDRGRARVLTINTCW